MPQRSRLTLSVVLGLWVTLLSASPASATFAVGTLPQPVATDPVLGSEIAPAGLITAYSTISIAPEDVGKTATVYVAVRIGTDLVFLSNGAWVPYAWQGPMPAYHTGHTLATVESTLLVTDVNVPPGTYGVFSGYQVPDGPLKYGGYWATVTPDLDSPAAALATALSSATTDEARVSALLNIMAALHIGVYDPSSLHPLVRGAERSAQDFYLYDFELQAISQSLARQDTYSLGDIAAYLKSLDLLEPDVELTAEELRQMLVQATQSAVQNPSDPQALTALLVRELGLHQAAPSDILTTAAGDAIQLTALQYWLILADILLPLIWEAGPATAPSALPESSGGILKRGAADFGPCEEFKALGGAGWKMGKFALELASKLKGITKIAKAVTVSIDAVHGPIMALGIQVISLDPELKTHYGHESPGEELHFRTLVYNHFDPKEAVVKCGWLLGVEFPPKGPIAGVTVQWAPSRWQTLAPLSDLKKHGEISCSNFPVCVSTTDANGIATLIFKPKTEKNPGRGAVRKATGTIVGVAYYQAKLNNILGAISNVLIPPAGQGTEWVVEYHQPVQYKGWVRFHEVDDNGRSNAHELTAEAQVTFELEPTLSTDEIENFQVKEGTLVVTVKPRLFDGFCGKDTISINGAGPVTYSLGTDSLLGAFGVFRDRKTYMASFGKDVSIPYTGTEHFPCVPVWPPDEFDGTLDHIWWLNTADPDGFPTFYSDIRTLIGFIQIDQHGQLLFRWEWGFTRVEEEP